MPRWKTRRSRLGNNKFEVLSVLAKLRPGRYTPLELKHERIAKQMTQGVHPWIKTRPSPVEDGTTWYCVTSDGRSKLDIERSARDAERK